MRHGKTPKALPDDADFDAARGSISTSYEGAWLACRMIAEKYGEKKLVKMYAALTDSAGPGWPAELPDELGVSASSSSCTTGAPTCAPRPPIEAVALQ